MRAGKKDLGQACLLFFICCFSAEFAFAQNQTTNPPNQQTQQNPPVGTNQPQNPSGQQNPNAQQPPNTGTAPINPTNEQQQSTQPQPRVQQEQQQTSPNTNSPRPTTPQIQTPTQQNPAYIGQPNANAPIGTTQPTTGTTPSVGAQTGVTPAIGAPATPGQSVGASAGIAPDELPPDPPPVAPNFKASVRPLPSAERVGVNLANQLPITLEEAIAFALQNNNDIDSSQINVQIAEFNLRAANGVYDPLVSSESFYERTTTPVSSVIGGGGASGSVTQSDYTGSARLGGFSPYAGGQYQLDFTSTRLTTTNQNVLLNPQFPSALTLTYTQPLWRGLRFDINRRNIEIAKKNLSLTDAQFRQNAIQVILQVEQGYWDLVFALRNLQVQIDAVKQARTQLESNQRLVAKGALAPIEIVAANTQVTTFEQNVYTAQEAVTRAENILKTLMLKERSSEIWSRPLTPITPVDVEPPQVELNQAIADALHNRPEIAQLQTNAEINEVNQRFLREQTKPQINLVGTYTAAGLAGIQTPPRTTTTAGTTAALVARVNQLSANSGLPPLNVTTVANTPPANLVGNYINSLGNLLAQDYPTFRVGVQIQLPLRNRVAEANLGSALAQGAQIKNQQLQQQQIIEADVRNALQALRSSEARLQSAAAARSSSEQQLSSEQRQFKAGASTVFLVLQRQTELLAARGNELQAQTALNKAISEFQRATGTTLSANKVSINKGDGSPQISSRPITIFSFNSKNLRQQAEKRVKTN